MPDCENNFVSAQFYDIIAGHSDIFQGMIHILNRYAVVFLSLLVLSSCMLLPVEEEPLSPPVISAYESAAYQFAVVQKDTLQRLVDASAQKVPAHEESFSFPVGQVLIENVHVEVGSFVSVGDIIAELDKSDLESRLKDAYYQKEQLEMRLRHAEEMYLLGKKYSAAVSVDEHAYETNMADYTTRLKVLEVDIAKLQDRYAERTLLSGMSGSVTYLKKISDGDRSIENERIVTITDTTVSVFVITGQSAHYYVPGEIVQMRISGSEFFDITVADPIDLGVYNPNESAAYFALTDIPADYMNAKYATVRYIIEEKSDVLCLPRQAINEADGETFVYMLNDNVRELVPVVVGMESSNGLIEIISGLEEDDSVIIP